MMSSRCVTDWNVSMTPVVSMNQVSITYTDDADDDDNDNGLYQVT